MDYRKLLNEYYEYLGDARPVHKMITNHLLFFADWLNTHTEEETILDTSHRDRESTLNKLFHAELPWFNPPHKENQNDRA